MTSLLILLPFKPNTTFWKSKSLNQKRKKTVRGRKKTEKEAIDLLEETVKVLEIKANLSRIDKKTTEVQTDISELERASTQAYLCGDCEYAADCIHDFNEHTHSQDEDHENSLFTYNFL